MDICLSYIVTFMILWIIQRLASLYCKRFFYLTYLGAGITFRCTCPLLLYWEIMKSITGVNIVTDWKMWLAIWMVLVIFLDLQSV